MCRDDAELLGVRCTSLRRRLPPFELVRGPRGACMTPDLKAHVLDRLIETGVDNEAWSSLVLAALDGPAALDNYLGGRTTPEAQPQAGGLRPKPPRSNRAKAEVEARGVLVTATTVEGLIGIGPGAHLILRSGPDSALIYGPEAAADTRSDALASNERPLWLPPNGSAPLRMTTARCTRSSRLSPNGSSAGHLVAPRSAYKGGAYGSHGVQRNARIHVRLDQVVVQTHLEGTAYDGWPIARVIEAVGRTPCRRTLGVSE